MQVSAAAKQLKALRERAGYGVRPFARLIGYSASKYHYYEQEFKKAYLPVDFVELIRPFLLNRGNPPISHKELAALCGGVLNGPSETSRDRDTSEVIHSLEAPTGMQIDLGMAKDVPVLGTVSAPGVGPSDADFIIMNGDAVAFVRRPPRLEGRKDIFALWVRSNTMARWRSSGDLVYCEGVRAPRDGDYVVIEMRADSEDGSHPAYLKKLISQSGANYEVEQYNPAKTFKIPKAKVSAIYRVVDWVELLTV